MRCCCDDVGPELMKCPRCGYPMAPVGRSVSAYMGGYCNCEERLWDDADATELHAFLRSVQKRSGLWPGERWGDSLPCIGDVCVAVAKKDDDECSGDMKADDAYLIRKFADAYKKAKGA